MVSLTKIILISISKSILAAKGFENLKDNQQGSSYAIVGALVESPAKGQRIEVVAAELQLDEQALRLDYMGTLLSAGDSLEMLGFGAGSTPIKRRFDAVVTPCVLYGSASWTMTTAAEKRLRTTQRKMLRTVLGKNRKVQRGRADSSSSTSDSSATSTAGDEEIMEPWISWISRCTEEAEKALKKVGAKDWVEEQNKRKRQWAAKVVSMSSTRWSHKALLWLPNGTRNVGHPRARWKDQLSDSSFPTSV